MALFRRVKPPFGLKTLVKDSNCVLIQDPSAIWGGSDYLPRRNLLTYSEDFSNAAWLQATYSAALSATSNPFGGAAFDITQGATGAVCQNFACSPNTNYVYTLYAQRGTGTNWKISIVDVTGGFAIIYPITSRYADINGSTWTRLTIPFTTPAGCVSARVYLARDSDSAGTVKVCCPQVTLASTTDQSYQRITDWTTEQYAWAATKNVPWLRRSLLVYSDMSGGTTAPTGWTYYGTANNSAKTGSLTADGCYIWSSAATASRDHLGITTASLSANTVHYVSITVHAVTGGLVASNYFFVTAMPSGSSLSYEVCTANPSGGNSVISNTGTLTYKITIGATAGTVGLRIGVGIGGDQTGTFTYSSPVLSVGAPAAYQAIAASWGATYTSLAQAAGYPISLYSDRAGTTATVGPDDPVGVLLDQKPSGTNTGVSVSQMSGSGWTVSNGVATHTPGTAGSLQVLGACEIGSTYLITCSISGRTVGGVYLRAGLSATSPASSGNGVFSAIATCITDTYLRISPVAADFDGSVSNLILIKLANHAVAPSDAARPNLRLDGNGRWYLDRDTTDDNLPITWPTVLSESQLGPELVTNGTFPTNADGWMASANATVAWSSGKLQLSAAAAYPKVTQPITLSVGKYYEIIVDLEYVDAPLWVMVSSADTLTPDRQFSVIQYTSNTKFRLVFKSTIATAYVGVSLETTSAGKLGYIDNVSVREATGTNVIYTATGDYTTKDSGLILSGATDYKYPQRPSGDYGRIVMAAESKYDAKIIKYLDQKRGRSYLLGPELVTNGGFDSATWWATSGEVTISGGVATIASTGASAVLNRNSLLTATKVYLITFSVVWRSGLGKLEASGGSTHTLIGASGTYSAILSGSTNLVFNRVSACSFDLDNISVREILL